MNPSSSFPYRSLRSAMAILMLLSVFFFGRQGAVMTASSGPDETYTASKPLIVVDPGHGGIDPGKIGVNNALEKDINLSLSLILAEKLSQSGCRVILTREEDQGLYSDDSSNKKREDLNNRSELISELSPELVVSIHQNSYHDSSVSGPQVFYYKASENSRNLAQSIQSSFTQAIGDKNTRSPKANDSYYLLLHTPCPCVIVECGFLSNWEEASLLLTEEYQNLMAEAISSGVLTYLDSSFQS